MKVTKQHQKSINLESMHGFTMLEPTKLNDANKIKYTKQK